MALTYKIMIPSFPYDKAVEIDQGQYEMIKSARKHLLSAINTENSFDILLENFWEFERELLDTTLRQIVFPNHNWFLSMDNMSTINRRIINLLSTTKFYLDSTPQVLNDIYGKDSTQAKAFVDQTHLEYDTHLAYRAMEAIRNHIQHNASAIRILRHGYQWEQEPTKQAKNTIAIMVSMENFRKDESFNKRALRDLEALSEEDIDIKSFIREYLGSFGRLHSFVRAALVQDVDMWKSQIVNARNRYRDETGDMQEGISIIIDDITEEKQHREVERIPLMKELLDRHDQYLQKNMQITHYGLHYVSGEIRK